MRIISSIPELQNLSDQLRGSGKIISLIPTMGFLHDGHASLIREARKLSDIVITSIFVNPTQFAPHEDFSQYPRDFERDREIAAGAGCDIIFSPLVEEMYPAGFSARILIGGVTEKFEGKFRPTHFEGVATVVAKLFNAAKPHKAFFGQKDYQQTLVIKKLVRDLNFDLEIVVVPTRREDDGLAMSSRNVYLSAEERKFSRMISQALREAREKISSGEKDRLKINSAMEEILRRIPNVQIDYASAALADDFGEPDVFSGGDEVVLLIAARVGKTRLIDNELVVVNGDAAMEIFT